MKKRMMFFLLISMFVTILFFIFNFIIIKKDYKDYVTCYCMQFNLEIPLIYAIIKVESNFDTNAESSAGAKGLMQIIPSTAKWIANELGENFDELTLFNSEKNIKFGCYYLRYLFNKFNDMGLVICAYNAGETVAKNWTKEDGSLDENKIAYPETKNYYQKVMKYYNIYSKN